MNKTITLSCLLLLWLCFACGGDKPAEQQRDLGNTPYQEDTIMVTYASNPERALTLLDSAVALGNVNEYAEKIIRATIYSKSLEEQHQDSAIRICEALLEHDSVVNNPDQQDAILDLLINISRAKIDDNDYVRWATQKAELCRKQGEVVEVLRTEAEIGLVMTHIGRIQEGIDMIDRSVRELDKPGSIDRMDAFIIASKRKITVLNELGRPAETIPVAQGILDRLVHFEQHTEDYAADSWRLVWKDNVSERDRYIDFCRAQAHGMMAIAYAATGNQAQARQHLTTFDGSNYGKSFSARRMIVPAQISLGMYDDALKTCDQWVQHMGTDTMNTAYAKLLNYRAIATNGKGHPKEAYQLMTRYTRLSKVLSDSLHNSQAQDYAARYHEKEQQMKLQESENISQRKTIIAIAITLLLVITIIALIHSHRQRRHIAAKNRALVRMINESGHLTAQADDSGEDADDTGDDAAMANDASDDAIQADNGAIAISINDFETIDTIIRRERLYSNANLQRQDICKRFGITRIMLNNMLSQHRGNASLPQYINSIRIEEAAKLLRNRPDLSLTAIAEKVGFSPANFRKQFTRSLGITPMEFRQNL